MSRTTSLETPEAVRELFRKVYEDKTLKEEAIILSFLYVKCMGCKRIKPYKEITLVERRPLVEQAEGSNLLITHQFILYCRECLKTINEN